MRNKKLILGIAAGAAILAGAAVILSKRRAQRNFDNHMGEARQHFKGKLNELQRRAEKEYKNSPSELKEAVNTAKERANEWVNKANA